MRINNSGKRIIHSTFVIMMVLCLVLSSCGRSTGAGVTTSTAQTRNTISSMGEDVSALHYAASHESYSKSVVSSGFIELKVDENTNSFAVYNNSDGVLWSSLPILEDTVKVNESCNSSLVSLRIAGGTDVYLLNSQDNSLAYNKASIKENADGADFIFDIFANQKTAEKKTYSPDDIGFRVVLSAKLKDGNMTIDCSWKNLTGNKNACIEDMEVLNYFGSYNDMGKNNFLFVPDGCGAIVKTAVYDESFESLSFDVYGSDPARNTESSGNAILPVFGIRRGDSAVAAIIEGGDAVATIKADKATDLTGYNRCYSSFNITPVTYVNDDLYISKKPALKKISICYRFLSGKNASYAGMASAVREQLIRDSVLSMKTVDTTDYIPFFVSIQGTSKKSIGKFRYTTTITDFEQTQDLLSHMKNKGINNVSVIYGSILSGGCDPDDVSDFRIMHRLGGKKKFSALTEYMSNQKMNLYVNIDLISSAEGFGDDNSKDMMGNTIKTQPQDDISDALGTTLSQRFLRNLHSLKSVIASILLNTKNYSFTGFCFDDAGKSLHSDFSENGVLRQEASEILASTISPLSTSKSVIVAGGNFYMLKNADAVINLPLSTSISKSGSYMPVPFAQLVLHGIADYTGEAINTQTDSDILLKYIEYGACPLYEWNYTALEGNGEDDPFYYSSSINKASENYAKLNSLLNDLRDARITDHYEVQDGVFCTEYDTGAMIYVNYTDTDCTVLGVVVDADSYIRVN